MDSDNSIFNFTADILSDERKPPEETKEGIEEKILQILRQEFPHNLQKQKVKDTKGGFNFACPYCGDSAYDDTRKRAHLTLEGKWAGHFKCYNCGKHTTALNFFKDFNESLDLSSLSMLADASSASSNMRASSQSFNGFDKSEIEKYGVSKPNLMGLLRAFPVDVQISSKCKSYLISRRQNDFSKFLYIPSSEWLVILNCIDDIVIGFQLRDLSGKRASRYNTFNLSRIHSSILRDCAQVPDKLDQSSLVFNLYTVDWRKPVIVTEGPLDSFLVPNGIATAGANKHISLPMKLFWLFDNDETGRKHAIEKLNNREHVFMWQKLADELGLPQRKKWDVNDVVKWLYMQGKNEKVSWLKYFTNDSFDMLYI